METASPGDQNRASMDADGVLTGRGGGPDGGAVDAGLVGENALGLAVLCLVELVNASSNLGNAPAVGFNKAWNSPELASEQGSELASRDVLGPVLSDMPPLVR